MARPDEANEALTRILLFWRRPLWSCSANEFIKVAIRSAFDFIDQWGSVGKVVIATENYAAWMSGATFVSPFLDTQYTIGGTLIRFDDYGIARLEVLTT